MLWYIKIENEEGAWVDDKGVRYQLAGSETVYCPAGHNADCGAIQAASEDEAAAVLGLTYDPLPEPKPEN